MYVISLLRVIICKMLQEQIDELFDDEEDESEIVQEVHEPKRLFTDLP